MFASKAHRRNVFFLSLALTSCLAILSAAGIFISTSAASVDSNTTAAPNHTTTPKVDEVTTLERYGKLPLSFEVNAGQTDSSVKFLARGIGYGIFLTKTGAVISLPAKAKKGAHASAASQGIELAWVGASNDATVEGVQTLPGKVNYFLGSDARDWRSGIATFARVKYEGLYPGIDLVYYGNQGQLEYDLIIQPKTDPRQIRFAVSAAEKLRINRQGQLVIGTPAGSIKLLKPVAYQLVDGKRKGVASRYRLHVNGEVSFLLGRYDRQLPLTIDPVLT